MQNEPKRTNETAERRKARLAAELRANLQKRKAQARAKARVSGSDGETSGTVDTAE